MPAPTVRIRQEEQEEGAALRIEDVIQAVRDEHRLLRDWLCQWAREQEGQCERHRCDLAALLTLGQSNGLGAGSGASMSGEPPQRRSWQSHGQPSWMPPVEPAPLLTLPSPTVVAAAAEGGEARISSAGPAAHQGSEAEIRSMATSGGKLRWESYELEMLGQRQLAERMLSNVHTKASSHKHPLKIVRRLMAKTSAEPPKTCLARAVQSPAFNMFVAFVIVLNTVFMGVETDLRMQEVLQDPSQDPPAYIRLVNMLFNSFFAFELLLRLIALRLWFFIGSDWQWNMFDVVLVMVSLAQLLLEGMSINFVRAIRILRVVRVARIFRVARMFSELRELVLAMFHAVAALAWSIVLLLMLMYTFSIMFVQGATGCVRATNCDLNEIMEWYPSVLDTMYTLMQAISGGDWSAMSEPLTEYSSAYKFGWILYLIMTMFCLLNLLTGVFVAVSSEVQSRSMLVRQKMQREEEFVRDLKDVFQELDTSSDGNLSREELSQSLTNEYVVAFLETAGLTVTDMNTLFELLDYNNSGDVTLIDFIAGCQRLRGPAKSMYMQKLLVRVDALEHSCADAMGALHQQLQGLTGLVWDLRRTAWRQEPEPEQNPPAHSATAASCNTMPDKLEEAPLYTTNMDSHSMQDGPYDEVSRM